MFLGMVVMPRQKRADEGGMIYHALNRGNARQKIFRKDDDYVERNPVRAGLVQRAEDWRHGSLWRWTQKPQPPPRLLSSWPLPRPSHWIKRVNQPLTPSELDAVRLSVQRGRPFGDPAWTEQVAQRTGLRYTLRLRGRPRKHPATGAK